MPSRVRNWLTPAAWVAGVSAALLILFPTGFPNYDTIYALVWGRELAHGVSPDYGAALPPTPHPLADLLGAITTPLGDGAITVTMIVAYVSLGLVGYLVYRLGSLWFDRPIGAVAALIVLTRAPYLSNGLRAYVDVPYIALVLGALVIESKKPRAGWPVLTLLALAGLLRPEAWGFAIAYWLWLALDYRGGVCWRRERTRRELVWFALLALAGPICWLIFDGITTGNFLYSLTGTQETVETLKRHTGPVDLVLWGPRALGEVMQWPGMVGALGGVILAFAFLRRRAALGLAAAVLALAAFAALATAGLAIIARYTMLGAAILAIFVAVALLGWRLIDSENPWRRRWQVFAGVVALMFVLWLPNQWNLDSTVHSDLANQGQVERDLYRPGQLRRFRQAALRQDRRAQPPRHPPSRLQPRSEADRDRQRQRGRRAAPRLLPRPRRPLRDPQLHPRPQRPHPLLPRRPPRYRRVAANRSWLLYRHC